MSNKYGTSIYNGRSMYVNQYISQLLNDHADNRTHNVIDIVICTYSLYVTGKISGLIHALQVIYSLDLCVKPISL